MIVIVASPVDGSFLIKNIYQEVDDKIVQWFVGQKGVESTHDLDDEYADIYDCAKKNNGTFNSSYLIDSDIDDPSHILKMSLDDALKEVDGIGELVNYEEDELDESVKNWDSWSVKRRQSYLKRHPNVKRSAGGDVAKAKSPDEGPKTDDAGKKKDLSGEKYKSKQDGAAFAKSIDSSPIKNSKFIGVGVNNTYLVEHEDGTKHVFKTKSAMPESSYAARKILEMMGSEHLTPNIHQTVIHGKLDQAKGDTHEGFAMEFADGDTIGLARTLGYKAQDHIKKIKSEDIVNAALFDVLSNNPDRNLGNVLVDQKGKMTLIDHDVGFSSKTGNLRSMFIPQTYYGTFLKDTNYEDLFYTKHVPGGKIGKNYPPKFKEVLDKIASGDGDVRKAIGLKSSDKWKELVVRANELKEKGFEAVVDKYARKEPRNYSKFRMSSKVKTKKPLPWTIFEPEEYEKERRERKFKK